MQSQRQNIARHRRFTDEVVPAELLIVDFDIYRLIEIIVDGAHQQQVVGNISFVRRFRKKQHCSVVLYIEGDGVILAALSYCISCLTRMRCEPMRYD